MNTIVRQFFTWLIVAIVLTFSIHILFLHFKNAPLFQNRIILSYIINTLLAIGIYLFLFYNRIKHKESLGFLYMAGSFFKLVFFGLLLYPSYHKDGTVSKTEFFTFFTPYVVCLIIETYFLIKVLNSPELNQ